MKAKLSRRPIAEPERDSCCLNSPIPPCFYCRLPFFIPSCSFLLSQSANMRSLLFGKARCVQVGAVGQIACLGSPGSCNSARCARTSVALTGNSAGPNWAGLRCRWRIGVRARISRLGSHKMEVWVAIGGHFSGGPKKVLKGRLSCLLCMSGHAS